MFILIDLQNLIDESMVIIWLILKKINNLAFSNQALRYQIVVLQVEQIQYWRTPVVRRPSS